MAHPGTTPVGRPQEAPSQAPGQTLRDQSVTLEKDGQWFIQGIVRGGKVWIETRQANDLYSSPPMLAPDNIAEFILDLKWVAERLDSARAKEGDGE